MYPSLPTKKFLVIWLIIGLLGSALLPLWRSNIKAAQASSSQDKTDNRKLSNVAAGKYPGMAAAAAATQPTLLDVRVSSGANDVEQRLSDGYMYINSSDLELTNDPGVAKGLQSVGMRFTGLSIPKGATITQAYVEFQVDEASSEATSLVFHGEAADNAAAFTTAANNVTSRAKTAAWMTWINPAAWSTIGAKVQSPDLSGVIQEIVNRGGWASGNSLVLIADGTGRRVASAYEGNATGAPLLHVAYLPVIIAPPPTNTPLPPTPVPTQIPPTPTSIAPSPGTAVDVRVSSGANDVEQRLSDGYMYINSSDLELTNDPGVAKGLQSVGMRFTGLSIPKGATITQAYVEFQVKEASSEATSLVFHGEAADNAAAFTTAANNVTSRAKTAASTSWINPAAWSTIGAKVQTPDLSGVIQEIVNRGGWASGNSLVLIADGTGRRVAYAYEGNATGAALLHVVYTTGGPAPAPTNTPLPPAPTNTPAPINPTPTPTASNSQPMPVGQTGNWRLVFSDEFNGSTLDTSKWYTCFWWADTTCSIETNKELELYNSGDVMVQNGLLRLRAQKRDMVAWNGTTYHYTSGMVMTGGRSGKIAPGFTFTYGYAEARVLVPAGQGLWPAFWMLPASYTSRPEIDIMEILGHQTSAYHMNYHYIGGDSGFTWNGPDFSAGWHVLGIDWEPNAIVWYVDGVERWRYTDTATISNVASYLLLNLAVGGNWPGSPDSTTPFPSYYDIDYVRAWQK